MTTIGMLGGMSWHSSATYYRVLNESVHAARGGHASADVVLASLDFERVRALQVADDWDGAAALLTDAALGLQAAGAGLVVLCTNYMHRVAPAIEAALSVPFLHIADAVAERALASGMSTIGLLGARPVMEESFYADRLRQAGLEVLVPDAADRALVDRVIFDELTQGRFTLDSRKAYAAVIESLASRGAQGVALACTEIGLLVGPDDTDVPLLDTALVHAAAAAAAAAASGQAAS